MELNEAISRLRNFRDRYKEWAEKDDYDITVMAVNHLIAHAEKSEPNWEGKDLDYNATLTHFAHQIDIPLWKAMAMMRYAKEKAEGQGKCARCGEPIGEWALCSKCETETSKPEAVSDWEKVLPKKRPETSRCDPKNDFSWGYNRAIDDCLAALSAVKPVSVSMDEIEGIIDFWLQHLVAKVTDPKDYISHKDRIEGHRKSIATAIAERLNGGRR